MPGHAPKSRLAVPCGLAIVSIVPFLGMATTADIDREDHWRGDWKAIADESDAGFLVWESNRSGSWRIYRRELDGSDMRQLTPDDPGREHYCPHLSPDGTRMVYVTLPAEKNFYGEDPITNTAEMHLINTDGTGDRVIVDACRAYYEDRAVLWIDDDSLFFISGEEGTTKRLTLSTGEIEEGFRWDSQWWGWLPNAQETHITAGWPMFPPYDKERRRILFRATMQGCQPYFSLDGKWGYFTGGAGGPLHRYDLETREYSPIVDRHDPRLPEFRRYTYFPMLSACQNVFSFGASCYEHDHFTSDYDIFLAPIDPFTLELEGKPLRYTFDRGCDRFPDVHFTRMRLGKQRGMAPFAVDFSDRVDGEWEWDFGDGSAPSGAATHTYEDAGSYWVVATRGDERRRGRVRVDPLTGPVATTAVLTSGRQIEIEFDAPIELVEPAASLEAAPIAETFDIADDGRTLLVGLDRALRESATITVSGVVGSDDRRLPVVADQIGVRLEGWPVQPRGLVFAFEHGKADNLALDPSGAQITFGVEPHGAARFDRRFALVPGGGHFESPRGAANLVAMWSKTGAFSLDAVLEPLNLEQKGRIVELASADGREDLTIDQDGKYLDVRVRTGPGEERMEMRLEMFRPISHLSIGGRSRTTFGKIKVAFGRVDGVTQFHAGQFDGDFTHWGADRLRFGSPDWRGAMRHIAGYDRVRTSFESERDARLTEQWNATQAQVPERRAKARLVAKADIPTLQQIAPYPDALAVFEYEMPNGKVRVAHWVILGREVLPIAERKIGDEFDVRIEPFDAHPEAAGRFKSEAGLKEDFNIELWMDATR